MAERPNVLLICTDQQFAGAMSCAGNADLETPAMDRLAATGTRFPNSYCAFPVCVPSRRSMLSGRMPHEFGMDVGEGLPPEYRERSLGVVFEEAGYDTAWGGKWHVDAISGTEATRQIETHGFTEICGIDDDGLADACIEYLEADHDRPFLLGASFDDPHNICEWARNQAMPWGSVEDVPTEEYPTLPQNFAVPPFEPEIIRTYIAENPSTMGAMLDAAPEKWREYRHVYYRLIERVDREVGRILDALDEQGLREETVVVFTSDHGDGHGSHQFAQKLWLYEEPTRVPFIVSQPGETAEGHTDDRLVSTGLDLLPTLCEYAGIDAPEGLRGRSVRDAAAGAGVDEWREYVVSEIVNARSGGGKREFEARMLRTEQYKYVVYEWGENREQLFDLENDPGELVDLSVDADHADVLAAHHERLLQWCVETDDTFGSRYTEPDLPRIPGYDAAEIETRLSETENVRQSEG